jgi:hypothetical protein
MRVVIVKFPAGKTKQTVRLQHVASGKIFVRLLYCSLRVLGRDPSVGGAPLSEDGLRGLICLLKRFPELVLCQHLISPRAERSTLQTRSKHYCKLTVAIMLPRRKAPDAQCDWEDRDSLDFGFRSLGSANPFLAPTGVIRRSITATALA